MLGKRKRMTSETDGKNTHSNTCKFYVVRKKRCCRMIVLSGDYCAEHQPNSSQGTTERKRILCPLDKKHTCYEDKLEKHLKVCNAKPVTCVPYISQGANIGENSVQSHSHRVLSDVPLPQLLKLIQKVNDIYEGEIIGKITSKILAHPIVEEELRNPTYGPKTKKHLHQTSSLLGILNEYGLLRPETCFVEFGAGKGQLSYWIYKVSESYGNTSVLLIERASQRHKYDNKLDKTNGQIHRIRADIADVLLEKVEVVSGSKRLVGVTKHLCGGATDLALRCLMNNGEHKKKVAGVLMAFCCHHRCQWPLYTGKEFFEQMALTSEDFDIMSGMVSWATCGDGKSRSFTAEKQEEPDGNTLNANSILHDRYKDSGLDKERREEIGRRCKQIIDWGRLKYLENQGFECDMHYYVTADVSLENVCIVAVNKNKG